MNYCKPSQAAMMLQSSKTVSPMGEVRSLIFPAWRLTVNPDVLQTFKRFFVKEASLDCLCLIIFCAIAVPKKGVSDFLFAKLLI